MVREGSVVHVIRNFTSISEDRSPIKKFQFGTVLQVDQDGDALIAFVEGEDALWVGRGDFNKLALGKTPSALGTVIISPQRTAHDGEATLRIFAKADEVMEALTKELGLEPSELGCKGKQRSADFFAKRRRVSVPYDEEGVDPTP